MTHVAYSWSSFSTKCRDAILGQAFPGVTLCDGENSHPLKPFGLGCLHMNESGLFSVMQVARQPSFLANEGKRFHCAQRRTASPGKCGTGFCTSNGNRQRHARPLSHPSYFLTSPSHDHIGCVSSEAPRNHLLLPRGLVQLVSASADGKPEPALGHQDERRGHCQPQACYLGTFASKKWDCNDSHFFYDGC